MNLYACKERCRSVLLEERRRVLRYPGASTLVLATSLQGGRRATAGFQGRSESASSAARVLTGMCASYNLRYCSRRGQMPVREIHEFVGPEEPPDNAMESGAGGGTPPRKPQGSYPKRFQNLSLICHWLLNWIGTWSRAIRLHRVRPTNSS